MKTRESWLQNGIFIYKTGLSPCYLPEKRKCEKNKLIYMLKLANQTDLS